MLWLSTQVSEFLTYRFCTLIGCSGRDIQNSIVEDGKAEDFMRETEEDSTEVQAPPITFTKEQGTPTDKLRAIVKRYFKDLIREWSKLDLSNETDSFGYFTDATFKNGEGKLASRDSYVQIVRGYSKRCKNLPKDGNGVEIPLSDFQTMEAKQFIIWRDHLFDSVTEGSGCKAPFRLVRANGEIPILTVYRMGTAETKEAKGKGARKTRKGKGKKSEVEVLDEESVGCF
jgi:hypothetical protein